MDKNKEVVQVLNHNIQIQDRKNISISGIKKIENFNDQEFFIQSVMGYILVKGNMLELIKLDTFQGTISIKGQINSLIYLEDGNKKIKKESMVAKLFK